MRRRNFVVGGAAALGLGSLSGQPVTAATGISDVEFFSPTSLLDANYGALTDDSLVAAWAETSADNRDSDGDGDAYYYDSGTQIPLVATDETVTAFGSILVADSDADFATYGNDELVLNVFDSDMGGSGTVLWDEGHDQYWRLSKCSTFESKAESAGYTIQKTNDLTRDLPDADAVVITTPSDFAEYELQELFDFVESGGAVYLFGQSDYNNYDQTENLNDVAGYLQLGFRFNDDEVYDYDSNDGNYYEVVSGAFNTSTFDYFGGGDGSDGGDGGDGGGLDAIGTLQKGTTYTVNVTSVADGDTVTVEGANGNTEDVRVLGVDTPETPSNSSAENVREWEGIEDESYLQNQGSAAKDWAKAELGGVTVDMFFDSNEPLRDPFDRVLGYLRYDRSGDGTRNTLYNRRLLQEGYARVYDSSLAKHDAFVDVELSARDAGRQVWSQSDPADSTEFRDRTVSEVFVPVPSSVRTTGGAVADGRVPLRAESTASQSLSGGVSYAEPPLVAVDESVNTAVVGGPLLDEYYDSDSSSYDHFTFVSNLIDYLGSNTGPVYIDGGHGQFGHIYSQSAEGAVNYLRHLGGEGGIQLRGLNTITSTRLSGGRALIVTMPTVAYTQSELDALSTFVSNGGSLILIGGAKIDTSNSDPRALLDDVAAGVGTDLRLNDDSVTDDTNNAANDPEYVTTTNFDTSFPLFDKFA
ncbi:thermonuclease family protein [Halobaculum sp. MBLA0143]|uniref:thermonuclease family protein n=1 Tax=Halobaculum sp. MBLA0143 TaxID=3079933 RepID=UPI003523A185